MTVLENNVISPRNKLSLKRDLNDHRHQLKRKCLFEPPPPSPAKRLHSSDMLNGYNQPKNSGGDAVPDDAPVATLSNMGNTCFLNSVLYTLRFAPTFLHNLHHLIGDLALVANRLAQNKARTSSLGRTMVGGALAGARSTSSKDLLALGGTSDMVLPKSKVQIVTEKLHELYVTMHNLEVKESNEPYQPVALLQAIREANYIFEGNHQQDAHELLVYLLDNIRETCEVLTQQVQCNPALLLQETVETVPQVNNSKLWGVRCSWNKRSQKKKEKANQIGEKQNGTSSTDTEDASSIESTNDANNPKKRLAYNFVAEDFEGITLRRTKCLECESVTERKEPFYDIPVPISLKDDDYENNSTMNPSEIYRKACVTSEKLCDSNKYLCEKCKRYNEASRDVLFEKLPNIMVLQLKRFTATTAAGVQKVNTYLPTPLELECFCETCCKLNASNSNDSPHPTPPHRYRLCCVIMHLGGTMASGHYIAYVKASSDHTEDYAECSRDYLPKGSLSASSSEKSLNILKFLKPRQLTNTLLDNRNSKSGVLNGVRMCKSVDCCGVRLNKNVVENVINSFAKKNGDSSKSVEDGTNSGEDMWFECDDENVRAISSQEFEEELSYKPNSTSTPYLLFYSKITDSTN